MKKLTLSMMEKDIRDARRLAKKHNTSISRMFSRLVRVMSRRNTSDDTDLPPITRRALGLLKLPNGESDRELLEDALLDRHGFDK